MQAPQTGSTNGHGSLVKLSASASVERDDLRATGATALLKALDHSVPVGS